MRTTAIAAGGRPEERAKIVVLMLDMQLPIHSNEMMFTFSA